MVRLRAHVEMIETMGPSCYPEVYSSCCGARRQTSKHGLVGLLSLDAADVAEEEPRFSSAAPGSWCSTSFFAGRPRRTHLEAAAEERPG